MTQTSLAVGIDCGKDSLDVATTSSGDFARFENGPAGWEAVRTWIAERGLTIVGMEASGGYERGIRDHLCRAGMQVSVLDPVRVRHFAKAMGQRAKTDRIDAGMIAAFTALQAPRDQPVAVATATEDLAALTRTRRMLVDKRADLLKILRVTPPSARAVVDVVIAHVTEAVATLDGVIARCIAEDPALTAMTRRLRSAPGIGEVTAAVLAARVPELGRISGAKIAALLGVAPFAHDSGKHAGRRVIAGGRADARRTLYMATLVAATRGTGCIHSFYAQLLARGKPPKVALVACMRKFIVRLNAMLAADKTWEEAPS